MIANSGFPTLADSPKGIPGGLQKGDIIFNHIQAEEILKHGFVTGSHAKLIGGGAHADGTVVGGHAFADRVSAYVPVKMPAQQASAAPKSVTITNPGKVTIPGAKKVEAPTAKKDDAKKGTEKKSGSKGDGKLLPKNVTLDDIDLVEVKLNNIERALNEVKTAAESAFKTFAVRAQKTTEEINKITSNITDNKKAATTYQAKANSYIKTGKYRLSKKELTQARKVGLGKGTIDSVLAELNNGAFEIDTIKTTSKANDAYNKVKSDKNVKQKKKDKLKKAAKKETKRNKIRESLKTKISNYQNWYDKSISALETAADLEQQRLEAVRSAFDLVKTEYEGTLRQYEVRSDLINSWIEKNEAQGNYTSKNIYNELSKNEGNKINKLYEERGKLVDKLQYAMSKGVVKGTEEYNNMQAEIDEVTKSIYEAKKSQEEFNKKIRELDYENFKTLQDRISSLSEELSFLTDIMSENPMFGEKGSLTEYGVATLGTYATQYNIAMQQASEYVDKIKKLSAYVKKLDNGGSATSAELKQYGGIKEARDRLVEYQSAQRSVIKNAYEMRKSIKSLIEEGFKEEVNSLKDIISEYTKMLDTQKSEYDYSKKITEQQEKITSLRRQLAAWGSVDTEEGSAKRQKTAKELRDAEQDLEESQEERRISQIKEMLSELSDQYDKTLNGRVDDIVALINNVINSMSDYQGNIGQTLKEVISQTGLVASESLNALLTKFGETTALPIEQKLETGVMVTNLTGGDGTIGGTLNNLYNKNTGIGTSVSSILTKLQANWQTEITNADAIAKEINKKINSDSAETNPKPASAGGGKGGGGGKKPTTTTSKTSTSTLVTRVAKDVNKAAEDPLKAKALAYINKKASKAKKARSKYSDVNKKIYDLTGGKVLSSDELKTLAKTVGVKYNNAKSSGTLYKKLKQLKIKGFRIGSKRVLDDDYYWTQEGRGQNELIQRKSDGAMLTRLGKGDMVFNADMTKTLWDFAKNPAPYLNTGTIKAPNVSSNITYGDSNIDITFNMPDVTNAEDFMRTLQKSKKFEQLVQSMTIGQLKGKGTLNKYTTRI